MQIRLPLSILLLLFALLTACTKEVEGPKGDKGDPGADALVSSTATFPVASTEWKHDSTDNKHKWRLTLYSDLITADIVKTGSIKLLIEVDSKWYELPYLFGEEVMQHAWKQNLITVDLFSIHNDFPDQPKPSNFRIVAVPGKSQ